MTLQTTDSAIRHYCFVVVDVVTFPLNFCWQATVVCLAVLLSTALVIGCVWRIDNLVVSWYDEGSVVSVLITLQCFVC